MNLMKRKNFEKILSVNMILVLVVTLELLLAVYLIISQNFRLTALEKANLQSVSESQGKTIPEAKASLVLVPGADALVKGKTTDMSVRVKIDKQETVSVIEGYLKYDPSFVKVNSVTTRTLFSKASEKDDPKAGVFRFILYSKKGEVVKDEIEIATLNVTLLKSGETELGFVLSPDGVDSSSVMKLQGPANLLSETQGLKVSIK